MKHELAGIRGRIDRDQSRQEIPLRRFPSPPSKSTPWSSRSGPSIATDMKLRDGPDELHAWTIRAWHLAILRFAVTLDNADKLGVFAIAAGIDRLGGSCDDKRQFGFFRKTSTTLCASILRRNQTDDATLRQYLAGIDDIRLQRVLAAAIAIEQPDATAVKRRSTPEHELWRGLPSRGNVHL
jgi:hypothetical protein